MKLLSPNQYQPWCQALFVHYQRLIRQRLPQARIEHIGASAIPNCLSKGDLDIFVGVERDTIDEAITAICGLGFDEKQDTLRTPTLCMLEAHDEDIAVQVVANGSAFECFLTFRDKLRQAPDGVSAYNSVKQSSVHLSPEQYRQKKSAFIERILNE